jgi:hypothetical protein
MKTLLPVLLTLSLIGSGCSNRANDSASNPAKPRDDTANTNDDSARKSDIQLEDRLKNTQAVVDISRLSIAIADAKDAMFARYVPCSINIQPLLAADSQDWRDLQQFFGPRFGKPSAAGVMETGLPAWGKLNGSQCLVFFLGGWQDTGGKGTFGAGFSVNSRQPFQPVSPTDQRRGPFIEFPTKRLAPTETVPMYVDFWDQPYYYMTTRNGGDYYTDGRMKPFADARGRFLNFNGFQVISSGANRLPGPGGAWTPGTDPYGKPDVVNAPGGDDLANFYDKMLGMP